MGVVFQFTLQAYTRIRWIWTRVGGVMSACRSDRPLFRGDLEEASQALERKPARLGMRAHVYVVGGAAMAMAYRRSCRTMDVDALTIDQRETVRGIRGGGP